MTTFAHVVAFTFASSLLSLSLNGASQQSSQTTEAGQIIEIKCSAYLKKPNNSTETKLDPDRERHRKLYAREAVKCVGEGYLKVEIYGRSLDVDQSYGWYPIPESNKGDDAAPGPGRVGLLKGTYRLYLEGTRNPDSVASSQLPNEWLRSLKTPDQIAIELNGKTVTLATSIAPRFSFEADGREHLETNSKGQTIKSLALIQGQRLIVKSGIDGDRTVETILSPQANGELKVTRRLYTGDDKPPTVAEAVYHRISELARFDDVYSPSGPAPATPDRRFPFKESDSLVAELNERISSDSAKKGHKFTLTVVQPAEYEGATVKGRVVRVRRSGRRVELALSFDSIHLVDGKSYRFAGTIEEVRDADSRVIGRAGIGASIGAIIGAIAGGGQGAAIGSATGVGTSTGAIYSSGTREIELKKGTEITIREVRFGPKI